MWPVSRKNKPKQFQCLFSDKTLLQETFLRVRKKFKIADIYIATNQEYVLEVKREILEFPHNNIISEPQSRGTASCFALAAAIISKNKPDETMAFFPADHVILNPDILIKALEKANLFLKSNPDHIVIFGIKPTYPETAFGYIKKGEIIKKYGTMNVHAVEHFIEKPDMMAAQNYLNGNDFLWNSGICVVKAESIIGKFKKYTPDTYKRLTAIRKAIGTKKYNNILQKEYPEMDKISIEYGMIENDDKVAVIPIDLRWSDIGSWATLKDFFVQEKKSHYIKGEHVDFGSENLLVYGSKKLITTIGVKDLVIIDAEDTILICDRNKSQLVSEVVKELEKSGKVKFL